MALILNDDEEQFRDSVRRVVAERSPLSKLRELMSSGQPFDADVWKQLSELGLPALIVPAELGGAEAGYSVLSVGLCELGAGLVASPLLASTLAAGTLLALGDEQANQRLLPGIASGELIATLASGGTGTVLANTGRADGGTLTGEISPVLNAAQAGVLLVPALDGPAADDRATALFEVDAAAPGVQVTPLPALDHSRSLARVRLDGAAGRKLGGDAAAALGFAQDLANLALASEQLGAMAACLLMTAEYAKIRIAFGRPIGSFQGVKHRLAELWTTWELAHAALRDAARAADERPADFSRAATVARLAVSASYVDAAVATVQLHGGIGFTWEHDAHLYQKNAMSQHALFGGPDEQLDRLTALLAARG
jgi:alkylation response protein AidB-like acyl-CoA dehydrogenase